MEIGEENSVQILEVVRVHEHPWDGGSNVLGYKLHWPGWWHAYNDAWYSTGAEAATEAYLRSLGRALNPGGYFGATTFELPVIVDDSERGPLGKGGQARILVWLISVLAVLLACPLVVVATLMSDAGPRVSMIAVAALPLFVISVIFLIFNGWRAVTVYGMPKMDVWWWLSAPYSVIFGLYFRLLRLERFAVHALPLFTLVFMATLVSTGVWTLVTLYQVVVSRHLATSKRMMLAFALLHAVMLWT